MSLTYTTRPISDRARFPIGKREESRFTAGWTDTLDLLEREIRALRGTHVVIEVDVPERSIRNDGMLYANARANTPAVVVAFDSKHGPLLYACDRYIRGYHAKMDDWQHNVRAIALTLEALRAVDRYGASQSGEQYRGYKALPAGTGQVATHMTADEALAVLRMVAGREGTQEELHRWARAKAHPDRNNGDRAGWDHVEQAARVLGLET
jgi:hypothetical protein